MKTIIDNNQQTFDLIRSGEEGRDQVVLQLYKDQKLRSMVYNFVLKNGGEQDDARSVFNYSLAKFIKAVVKNNDFNIKQSLYHYIGGIAKYTWYDELAVKNKSQNIPVEVVPEFSTEASSEDRLMLKERNGILADLLAKMRRNCKEVLMHWANGYSMEEIAKMLDYKSFMMAKKKKYECMKQLLKYIETNPEIKEKLR